MSRYVERSDLVDYETYEDTREQTRQRVMGLKRSRRIHLGEHLTFLFENRETLIYQIQEIMRVERIVRESSIQGEIDTYNAMLGDSGQLGCALLIEIAEESQRKASLMAWLGLEKHLYVRLEDGEQVFASYDPEQVGTDRLSAVQYLKFDTGGRTPVAIGTDFPALKGEVELSDEQQVALRADVLA